MVSLQTVKPIRTYMGRLSRGSDILEEMTSLCRREQVLLGRLEAIGAVQKARLGFYDQEKQEYLFLDLERPLEITMLKGNISLRDKKPFVHAHVTLSDGQGNTFGGHLASGTIAFACEFVLESFEGPLFERCLDEETGLFLWNMPT